MAPQRSSLGSRKRGRGQRTSGRWKVSIVASPHHSSPTRTFPLALSDSTTHPSVVESSIPSFIHDSSAVDCACCSGDHSSARAQFAHGQEGGLCAPRRQARPVVHVRCVSSSAKHDPASCIVVIESSIDLRNDEQKCALTLFFAILVLFLTSRRTHGVRCMPHGARPCVPDL